MINANESSIGRIREILDRYYDGAKAILDKDSLLENELEALDRGSNQEIFSNIIKYRMEFRDEKNINIDKLYFIMNKGLEEHDWRKVKEGVLKVLKTDWNKKIARIEASEKKFVNREELFISSEECNQALRSQLRAFKNDIVELQTGKLNKLVECFIKLLNKRTNRVGILSEECRLSLEKEECALLLPNLPDFDIGFIDPGININNVEYKIRDFDLSSSFTDRNKFTQFWANLFNSNLSAEEFLNYKEVVFNSIPEDKRKQLFEDIKDKIGSWLDDSVKLDKLVYEIIDKLKNSVLDNEESVKETFTQSNEIILENIANFRNIIDDTKKYKDNNDVLFRKKHLIQEIELASKDFIGTWKQILIDDRVEV